MKTKKDKRKKRERKLKERKHKKSLRYAYFKKYPEVFVKDIYANIDLVNEIKAICKSIDFRNFENELRDMFKDHKTLPTKKFVSKYGEEMADEAKEEDKFGFRTIASEEYCEYVPYIELEHALLLYLYLYLKDTGSWDKYMPIHNIIVRSYYGDFVVLVNSFHQHHSPFGKGYYTEKPAKVEIPQEDGSVKEYHAAFSMHALERVFERTYRCSLDDDLSKAQYPAFLYQFGLYSEVKAVKMSKGEDWGAAIYANYKRGPDTPHSLAHKISYEILDRMKNFKLLCGYCPIGFCKDEFVHFKTLLAPGMRGTPEEKVLKEMEDRSLKRKYEGMLSDVDFTEDHIELYRYLQNNGCLIVDYLNEEEASDA